jgi:hypothetical protein
MKTGLQRILKSLKTKRKAVFPVKPLIHSSCRNILELLSDKRIKFRNRTESKDFKTNDLSTWSLEVIVQKVSTISSYHYDAENLKNTKIVIYEEV